MKQGKIQKKIVENNDSWAVERHFTNLGHKKKLRRQKLMHEELCFGLLAKF